MIHCPPEGGSNKKHAPLHHLHMSFTLPSHSVYQLAQRKFKLKSRNKGHLGQRQKFTTHSLSRWVSSYRYNTGLAIANTRRVKCLAIPTTLWIDEAPKPLSIIWSRPRGVHRACHNPKDYAKIAIARNRGENLLHSSNSDIKYESNQRRDKNNGNRRSREIMLL